MNITIKATNMKLSETIEAYVHKRVQGLDKFVKGEGDDLICNVEIGKTTRHHKNGDVFRAEINLLIKGKQLYASSEKEDLYTAIDNVKAEIERELLSVKTKRVDKVRREGAKTKMKLKSVEN